MSLLLDTHPDQLSAADKFHVRSNSRAMPLKGSIKDTKPAMLLKIYLMNRIIIPHKFPAGKQQRPSVQKALWAALNGFLPDLLYAARQGRWGSMGTRFNTMGKAPGGRSALLAVQEALIASGHLERLRGFGSPKENKMGSKRGQAWANTCFRPTAALLNQLEDCGITPANLGDHMAPSRQKDLKAADMLEVRAAKVGDEAKGKPLPVDLQDPKVATIIERMERLNAFLLEEGRVDGISFGGLRRIFSNGDEPDFSWDAQGRLYPLPTWEEYGNQPSEVRAAYIRLDGEETAEVDISASHLTLLYGLLQSPYTGPEDRYDIPGFNDPERKRQGRDRVKEWLTMALGSSSSTIGGPPFRRLREAVLEVHPILGRLEELKASQGIDTHTLSFHESEVVLSCLEELRDAHGVTALPIHDALIVPKSAGR